MATRTISPSGGTRAWSDTASWVEAAVPTAADDVVATASSGNLTVDSGAVCRSADFTNYVGTLTHNAITWTIGTSSAPGSNVALKFVPGMTYTLVNTLTSAISFISTVTGLTITTASKTFGNMTFNGVGGDWTLQDSLTMTGGATGALLTMTNGAFHSGNQAMSVGKVSFATGTKTLDLGTSNVTVTGGQTGTPWNLASNTGLTLTVTSAMLNFTNSNITFKGNANTYGTVRFTGTGTATIDAGNIFATLERSNAAAVTLTLTASSTTTVTTLTISGTSGHVVTLNSSTPGTTATISKSSGTVSASFVSIQDNTGSGGAAFQASNATIGTNVVGWTVVGTSTLTSATGMTSSGAKNAVGTSTLTSATGMTASGRQTDVGTSTITTATGMTATGKKAAHGTATFSTATSVTATGIRYAAINCTFAWWLTPAAASSTDIGGQLTLARPNGSGAVEVDWDSANHWFTLRAEAASLHSTAQTFSAGAHIFLALRLSDAGVVLSVALQGQPIEHHSDPTRVAEPLLDLFFGARGSQQYWGSGTWGSGTWGGLSRVNGVVDEFMGFEDALTDAEVAQLATAVRRISELPSTEGRLVWYIPGDPDPLPAASALASGRITATAPDALGLTRAVVGLTGVSAQGLGLTEAGGANGDLAASLATTDTEDTAADHQAQSAAEFSQEVRVR